METAGAGCAVARGAFWLPIVGRLKPGVTRAQAQADLDAIMNQIEQQNPDSAGYGVNVVLLIDQIVGSTRRALGAGRWRIIRQLLTESLLLAFTGGALGVLLAWCGLKLLLRLDLTSIPRFETVGLDGRVLWFTFGLSLLTGLVFGAAPALQAAHPEPGEALKDGGRTGAGSAGRRAQRMRGAFIVAEMALTMALLVGAGLLIRSFWRLQQIDPGFKTDRLLTLQLNVEDSAPGNGPRTASFFDQLRERLAALPGVESVSATTGILLPKLANSGGFSIENRPPDPPGQGLELPFDAVQPNYFRTMGIEVLKGREFTIAEAPGRPLVTIVNETFVKRYFANEDPLGKRFTFGSPGPNTQWITIVGVVRDMKRQGLDQPVRIESWMPLAQMPSESMEVVVRTGGDPLALSQAVREAVWSLDRNLPISELRTLEQILAERVARRQLTMLLLGLIAGVALILAAIGIYGVMNYTVAQRTHEIGIRMALGASGGDVLRMVVWQGMRLTLAGMIIGLAATLALTRLMASLLFEVSATDPVTFMAIAVLLTGVALVACWIPARRATKVDPMAALRYE